MNKKILMITSLVLVIVVVIYVASSSQNSPDSSSSTSAVQNTQIKSGIQYITITAKGGYTPRVTVAKAGIPTKIIMKTEGTFDCSSALYIRSLGFQKILAQTAEEVIDAGTPDAGTEIQGVCSMGMYSFQITFS